MKLYVLVLTRTNMAGTKSPNNCPNCKTDSLDSHIGMQLSTKLTVEFCTQCGYVGSTDQSVKIPSQIVRLSAEAMFRHQGYAGFSDFVRDCIRRRCEEIINSGMDNSTEAARSLN